MFMPNAQHQQCRGQEMFGSYSLVKSVSSVVVLATSDPRADFSYQENQWILYDNIMSRDHAICARHDQIRKTPGKMMFDGLDTGSVAKYL